MKNLSNFIVESQRSGVGVDLASLKAFGLTAASTQYVDNAVVIGWPMKPGEPYVKKLEDFITKSLNLKIETTLDQFIEEWGENINKIEEGQGLVYVLENNIDGVRGRNRVVVRILNSRYDNGVKLY